MCAKAKVNAKLGDADGQYTLGFLYANGQGVPQDHIQALSWYSKAADQGNFSGQFAVGAMYLRGTGVPQDDAQAALWFRKAAEQGNARAQVALGQMYMDGDGVPQDYVQPHMWLNLAAMGLPASETKMRDSVVQTRDVLALRMSPDQIADAQKLAGEWKPSGP